LACGLDRVHQNGTWKRSGWGLNVEKGGISNEFYSSIESAERLIENHNTTNVA
jgi:hypothetical protein